ncbi:hypothetical protein Ddc_11038 [Ditylenchus destructor]|nr:hypothetical protein Ddc_11038 [Ditylenchus destructor]
MSGPRHSSTLPPPAIVLFVVPPKSSSTTEQRQIVDIRKCRAGWDRSTNVNMLDNKGWLARLFIIEICVRDFA